MITNLKNNPEKIMCEKADKDGYFVPQRLVNRIDVFEPLEARSKDDPLTGGIMISLGSCHHESQR